MIALGTEQENGTNLQAMETWTCSSCKRVKGRSDFHEKMVEDRLRPVASSCKQCRKEKRAAAIYPQCTKCSQHKKVNSNKICTKCNEADGIRECSNCGDILPITIGFYGVKKVCRFCIKEAKRALAQVDAPLQPERDPPAPVPTSGHDS